MNNIYRSFIPNANHLCNSFDDSFNKELQELDQKIHTFIMFNRNDGIVILEHNITYIQERDMIDKLMKTIINILETRGYSCIPATQLRDSIRKVYIAIMWKIPNIPRLIDMYSTHIEDSNLVGRGLLFILFRSFIRICGPYLKGNHVDLQMDEDHKREETIGFLSKMDELQYESLDGILRLSLSQE